MSRRDSLMSKQRSGKFNTWWVTVWSPHSSHPLAALVWFMAPVPWTIPGEFGLSNREGSNFQAENFLLEIGSIYQIDTTYFTGGELRKGEIKNVGLCWPGKAAAPKGISSNSRLTRSWSILPSCTFYHLL